MNAQLKTTHRAPTRSPGGRIVHDEATKAEAVDRYNKGEQVTVLMKYYDISRAGFYLWVKNHKTKVLEQSKQANMTPDAIASSDKYALQIENERLRAELRKTRDKLIDLMIKSGEL